MFRVLIVVVVALVALTGCGTPGAPQAPSLQLPQPPDDLTATRKGNTVTLAWTMSRETTDRATLRASKLGPTKICRGLANPLETCTAATNNVLSANGASIGELPPDKTPIPQQERGAPKLTYTDTLTSEVESGHETDFATYAVQILNSNGKAAGLSNEVKVPLAPVVNPPTEITASMEADGVLLRWFEPRLLLSRESFQQADRVMRRAENDANWTLVDTTGPLYYFQSVATGIVDHSFQWEHTYYYKVTPITRVFKDGKVIAEVEGDDSPEVKVFTKDTFGPAQPSGVQAVFSGTGQKPFIDLTWAPNTEEDLAGYNVYRHEQGTAPHKISSNLAKSPSFRDDNVQPGHTYFYSVTAVDLRNNESARSEETAESIPK